MDRTLCKDHALALLAIDDKIEIVQNVKDSRVEHDRVLIAIAEACWWIASLDEQLERENGEAYVTARDDDSRGFPIPGLR